MTISPQPSAHLTATMPGAKGHVTIADDLDDADLMAQVLRVLVREVPLPEPKKRI